MANLTEAQQSLEIDCPNENANTDNKSDKGFIEREQEGEEKGMAPIGGNSIHRSSSRPQLDLSGAAIQGNFEERDPTILLPNQSDDISHLALDIGGEFCCFILCSDHGWFFVLNLAFNLYMV